MDRREIHSGSVPTGHRGWPNVERWGLQCMKGSSLHSLKTCMGRMSPGRWAFSCCSHPCWSNVNHFSHHFAIDFHFSGIRRIEMEETGEAFHKWRVIRNKVWHAFSFLSKDKYKRDSCTCFRCTFKPSCVAFSSALTVKVSGSSLSRIWDSFNSDSSFFFMKDSTWCSVVPLFCKELSNGNYFP